MQINRIAVLRPNFPKPAVCLMGFWFWWCGHLAGDAAPFQITNSGLLNGKIMLAWTASANSYQVQRTESLASPNWTTVLASVRTNAALPLEGRSGYFRVRNANPSSSALVLTMTNLMTTDVLTLTLQTRTNTDLVFNLPPGANGVDVTQLIFPASELQKFDIAFHSEGDFTIVTNGEPTAWGGSWTTLAGPGTNEITYQGYLTNGADVVMFTAVTDPEPIEEVINGVVGTINWWRCSPVFAGPWLQCAGACTAQAVACAFNFPPRASYCNFVTHVSAAFDGSIICGNYECLHGCK